MRNPLVPSDIELLLTVAIIAPIVSGAPEQLGPFNSDPMYLFASG